MTETGWRNEIDWRKVAVVGVAINAAYAAFIGLGIAGAKAEERERRERTRVRWTDANRWE